ncbi:2,4'-dihydroxyacetophenone dioxygenase family protein [Noviherbaspirillum sp. ST9]|uniref:2,4'-dihydroxyacetophenone dioxygenase family protein n=1 Tax=Noviherbaspirillum sp. ST9 TaxID=3401606 RepID=UPI003B589A43
MNAPVMTAVSESDRLLSARTGKDFCNEKDVPWTPWVMPGTYFKLFCVNYQTGGFTTLLKIDPDFRAPVHRHLGAAEAYILEGGFYYDEDDQGMAGDYTYEAGGITHEPYSTHGCVMFAIVHGPNVGLDDNGNPNFAIDATMMMQIARENNVHAHVIEVGKVG